MLVGEGGGFRIFKMVLGLSPEVKTVIVSQTGGPWNPRQGNRRY